MASAADRFNINSQLEHLQSRYVGTGHADTNRFEWAVNIHRDSYAAYVGRPTMLQYFAVAENESIGRVRYNMMQVRDRPESRFVLDAWATVSTARSREATPLVGNRNPNEIRARVRCFLSPKKAPASASRVREPDLRPSRPPIDAENVVAVRGASRKRGRMSVTGTTREPRAVVHGVVKKKMSSHLRRPPNALTPRARAMADAWSARTAALRAALEAQGLDIVAPLNLRWYNEVAPATARVAPPADGAGEEALAVLVGNSRALWPAFTAAHDSDPAIGDAEHPVDTFVARAIRDAIADASNGSRGRTDTRRLVGTDPRVFDSHDTSPGKLVAIQRAAHVAGVAHLDEKCHLAIHARHGPWIALRALLVFDDIRGPDEAHRSPPPPNPLATDAKARARVDAAFAAALEGYEGDPDASAERWQRWVAVRDAVLSETGDEPHPERYYEDQVRYHYNCQTGGDARARIRDGLRAYRGAKS